MDRKKELYISTEDTLHMLINLNQKIDNQRENVDKLSKQLEELVGKLNILIKELVISDRRKLFKRNILNQEALINLLVKKKLISKQELLNMIKLLKAQSKL